MRRGELIFARTRQHAGVRQYAPTWHGTAGYKRAGGGGVKNYDFNRLRFCHLFFHYLNKI